MAFIKSSPTIGSKVTLDEDVRVMSGVFECGTKMTIIGQSFRGWNLEDDEGNKLYDYGVVPGPAKFKEF